MTGPLNQRRQYAKGGIGKWYWDFRDEKALAFIGHEKKILDVGCGEGITLEKLVEKFPNRLIKGIDYSLENVKVCKEFNLPVELGNVYQMNFENNSFDCCLFMEVIEHLENPLKALEEIHRILCSKGLLLLVFPHDLPFKLARLVCLKFDEAFTPSGHIKQWNPREMCQLLEQTGFSIIAIKYLPLLFWWCSLHCLIVSRKK